MKTKFTLIALLMGLFLASCEKSESYLELDKVNGKATIQGVVTYNQGERKDGDQVVMYKQPLANAEVVVSVNYSEYQERSEGVKKYTTTTDENGKYSIDIPVGLKTINASVSVKSFRAEYYSFDLVLEETKVNALYSVATPKEVALTANDLKWVAIDLTSELDNTSIEKGLKVSVAGTVYAQCEKPIKSKDGEETIGSEYDTKAVEAQAIVKFVNKKTEEELNYLVKTNASGEYSVAADLFTRWDVNDVVCEVETKPYLGDFKHWFEINDKQEGEKGWKPQTIKGLYRSSSTSSDVSIDNTIQTLKLNDIVIAFEPEDNCSIKGIGNNIDDGGDDYKIYPNNPMGWEPCN